MSSLLPGILWIATLPTCSEQPAITIDLLAVHNPPIIRSDFDTKQLEALATKSGLLRKHPPLGFYAGLFGYTIDVRFGRDANSCIRIVSIRLNMQLFDRRIEIADDLRREPCRYQLVLDHYKRHAAADDQVFSVYARRVEQALRKAPSEQILKGDSSSIKQAVAELAERALASFGAARDAIRDSVDTPEEVAKLVHGCST